MLLFFYILSTIALKSQHIHVQPVQNSYFTVSVVVVASEYHISFQAHFVVYKNTTYSYIFLLKKTDNTARPLILTRVSDVHIRKNKARNIHCIMQTQTIFLHIFILHRMADHACLKMAKRMTKITIMLSHLVVQRIFGN